MIKLVIKLILLIIGALTILAANKENPYNDATKFKLGKGATLINELTTGKVYGSLKNMVPNKAKIMQLIGHAYIHQATDPLLVGNIMVLIGWLGVQKINEPDKIVGFKEPIVSSFMVKADTTIKGVELPTFGEFSYVQQAIANLEQDQIDLQDLTIPRTIKAPIGQNYDFTENSYQNIAIQPIVAARHDPIERSIHEVPISDLVEIRPPVNNLTPTRANDHNLFSAVGSNYANGLPMVHNPIPPVSTNTSLNYSNPKEPLHEPINSATDITIELTEEGCIPEYDPLQEKVIITARAKKLKNGQVIDEGSCERTAEHYQVKRDYLCEQCVDEINLPELTAYARYMEYWIDKEAKRHNLTIKLDSVPFNLIEDNTGCQYHIQNNYCSKMSKLGYVNKFGVFKIVEACRFIEDQLKFPVRTTTNGCPYIHDFVNNVSLIQTRSFFIKNGSEHTVAGCAPVIQANHIFTDVGCQPIHHINNNFIYFARRIMVVDGNQEIISHECEPNPNNGVNAWANLMSSMDECSNQYLHDFVAGKSYIKQRYFYYDVRAGFERNKIYVTPCVRTNDFIVHQYKHEGEWEHDDEHLGSRAKLATYIEHDSLEIKIDGAKVRAHDELEPYNLTAERQENNKIVHIYTRADGSVYKKFIKDLTE